MQSGKELELLRKEMINLKDCITKYLGYVFAGSGAAVYGIGRMDKSIEHVMPAMALVSTVISIIISFIVLYYSTSFIHTIVLLVIASSFPTRNMSRRICQKRTHTSLGNL